MSLGRRLAPVFGAFAGVSAVLYLGWPGAAPPEDAPYEEEPAVELERPPRERPQRSPRPAPDRASPVAREPAPLPAVEPSSAAPVIERPPAAAPPASPAAPAPDAPTREEARRLIRDADLEIRRVRPLLTAAAALLRDPNLEPERRREARQQMRFTLDEIDAALALIRRAQQCPDPEAQVWAREALRHGFAAGWNDPGWRERLEVEWGLDEPDQ